MDQGAGFSLGRGTMVVEYRGATLQGTFGATRLALQMTQGEPFGNLTTGVATHPLPEAQQPSQTDPLGDRQPGQQVDNLPEVQLRDLTSPASGISSSTWARARRSTSTTPSATSTRPAASWSAS